jgi:8-amino-7-oxononanoate synthase
LINSFVDVVRAHGHDIPEEIAYRFLSHGEDETSTLTFRQLDDQSKRIAATLQRMAVPGDRVVLLYQPGLEFIVGFLGCLYAGMIAVPAPPPKRKGAHDRFKNLISHCKPTLIISPEYPSASPTSLNRDDVFYGVTIRSHEFLLQQDDEWHEINPRLSDIAFLQFTSGSTQNPRGVMISHENLIANNELIRTGFGHNGGLVGVNWLPFYHDMGLIGTVLHPLFMGRPSVLMPPASFLQCPVRWLKAISKYRGTTCGGPPFAYDLCTHRVSDDSLAELNLESWEVAFIGSEPVFPDTIARFSRRFSSCGFRNNAFYPCYGLAEATLIVTGGSKLAGPVERFYADDDRFANKYTRSLNHDATVRTHNLVSCGLPLGDCDCLIVDPASQRPLPELHVGEVWLRGRSVAHGYWNNVQDSLETFSAHLSTGDTEFWLRTGDLGFSDAGEIFITGRIKDLIKIRGRSVWPSDIEHLIARSHLAFEDTRSVVFVSAEMCDQNLIAIAEVRRSLTRHETTLRDAALSAKISIANEFGVSVDAFLLVAPGVLPTTSSGKIQRTLCKQKFQNDEFTPLYSLRSPISSEAAPMGKHHLGRSIASDLTTRLRERIAARVGTSPNEIGVDTPIERLGLGSLEIVHLACEIEEWLKRPIRFEVLSGGSTITDVVSQLEGEAAGQLGHNGINDLDRARYHDVSCIPASSYQFESLPEVKSLDERIALWTRNGVYPYFISKERGSTSTTQLDSGVELLDFSHFDYLGLAVEPEVVAAAQHAVARYGTSVSAAPLISGRIPLHEELECTIADWIRVDECMLYTGGHATNVTTIGHLLSSEDLVIYDEYSHNSLLQGIKLAHATGVPFRHNDLESLEQLLQHFRTRFRRALICTEGAFSMDGDICPLPDLISLKERWKAWLLVDEAQSMGVLGTTGRGASEFYGIDPRSVDIWMGVTSKALAGCGGYVAGSHTLIKYLKHTAPGFVFTTAMSPPAAAASLTALRFLQRNPSRVTKLQVNSDLFRSFAKESHLDIGSSRDSAIVPVMVASEERCAALAFALRKKGVSAFPMVWPAVPQGRARLRFLVSTLHTEEQIRFAIAATVESFAANVDVPTSF